MNNKLNSIIVIASLALAACESNEVQMVKGGTLPICPDKTVGQMVNGYMGDPKWESFEGTDGNNYVNVAGEITYDNQPTKAEIQFRLNKDNSTFQFQAWELGGKPASDLVAEFLFEKMCYADLDEYVKEAVEATIILDELKKQSSEFKDFEQLANLCGNKISQDGKTEMTFMLEMGNCMEKESKDNDLTEKIIKPLKKAALILQKMDGFPEQRKEMAEKYIWNDPRMAQKKAMNVASVIGPAMGTFKKLLEAYAVETEKLNTWKAIGYEWSNTSNISFSQITRLDDFVGAFVVIEGIKATNLVKLADCPALSSWIMQCGLNKDKEVICECAIESTDKDACESITPNFKKLCK